MRLIDADALDVAIQNEEKYFADSVYEFGISDGIALIHSLVGDAPTIDAVPVVRCKDCRWFAVKKGELEETYKVTGCYRLRELGKTDPLITSGNGFCSWGLRREDGDT